MKTALFLIQLIPTIIEIVKKLEETFPQSGIGPQKLQLLREMLEAAYSGLSAVWPTIEFFVERLVAFANKTGTFTKKTV